jgi:hypothetical protein
MSEEKKTPSGDGTWRFAPLIDIPFRLEDEESPGKAKKALEAAIADALIWARQLQIERNPETGGVYVVDDSNVLLDGRTYDKQTIQ